MHIVDFYQCSCTGKNLSRLLQPAIMAALAGEAIHGYRVIQRLTEMSMFRGQPPDASGIYRTLKDMERQGLVESSWELSDSGPAKRQYRLTSTGKACLSLWAETLEEYMNGLREILDTARQASMGAWEGDCLEAEEARIDKDN